LALREDQSAQWLVRYPNRYEDIRKYLDLINTAFLLEKNCRDKITPDDGILDLYHAVVAGSFGDSMEIEHFLLGLAQHFAYDYPRTSTLQDGRSVASLTK